MKRDLDIKRIETALSESIEKTDGRCRWNDSQLVELFRLIDSGYSIRAVAMAAGFNRNYLATLYRGYCLGKSTK